MEDFFYEDIGFEEDFIYWAAPVMERGVPEMNIKQDFPNVEK